MTTWSRRPLQRRVRRGGRAVALGGTRYVIGAIPDYPPADWRLHFGPTWDTLARAEQRFDPDHLVTPGQGMFPR
ncbi:MAG TPA: hypothetical protein VFT22_29885 [Kofleriaceae bacterium]|nr:hypothetical protein [Kofleriaceae bacterium]